MNRLRFPPIAALAAATAIILGFASFTIASATVPSQLTRVLESSGYSVVATGPVRLSSVSAVGDGLTVGRGDAAARVIVFEYVTDAQLRQDWVVAAGQPVQPKKPGADFTGLVAMTNADQILVFNPNSPNDSAIVRSVGQAFLSLQAPSSGTTAAAIAVEPPHTGNANLLGSSNSTPPTLPFWAGAVWTAISLAPLLLIVAGGLYLLRRLYR